MSVIEVCIFACVACNVIATALVLLRVQVQVRDLRKAWAKTEVSALDRGLRLTVVEKQVKDMRAGVRELSRTVGMIDRDVQELNEGKYPGSDDDHEARCAGCGLCMRGDCN
nr:MAG TPA: 4Fe-4S binding domain protein [Caudoviricetes sp.]